MLGRIAATDTYQKQRFLKSKSPLWVSVLDTADLSAHVLPAFQGEGLK
jgi:hypothetical protein